MSLREFNQFIDSIMPDRGISVENKTRNVKVGILYTFLRLQQMFKYEGLPESIPKRYLEFYLQMNGHCGIISHQGELYAIKGGFGGDPDAYYEPTKYVIANPYLKLSKVYTRDVDCVVMGNDSMYYGLFSLVSKYIGLMAENEISMNMSVINSRIMSIIVASTDNDLLSAEEYLKKIKDGKLGAVVQEPMFKGIQTQPYANTSQANTITNLIEYEQYLKASLFNELGLNANYNMKRESINSNESQLNDDMLTPLIDDMLEARKRGVEQINEMFGTDIKVDFASAWEENEITTAIELGGLENGQSADDLAGNDDVSVDNLDPMEQGNESIEADPEIEDPESDEPNTTDIQEDLEEIKEDLEEIKEEIIGGEENETQDQEEDE